MPHEAKIENVLVVLSPALINLDNPMDSALIRRATSLAKITKCKLELFDVCYDSSLDDGLFRSEEDPQCEQKRFTDQHATRVTQLVTRLEKYGVDISYDVRWDCSRADAVLRKIAEANPDIVMKQARENSYFLGLATNTDWELARRSPAHIWLVDNEVDDINRIIAAVGNKFGEPDDITTTADYDLLRTAGVFGDVFEAAIYPLNAYQLPTSPHIAAGNGAAPVLPLEYQDLSRKEIVQQHRAAVRSLAQSFNIPKHNIHVCEGHPNQVIPEIAETVGADMIVMGAKSLGRLERLISAVTVEPVMAATNCDILIVRERDLSRVPDMATTTYYGEPEYDLGRAITEPDEAFDSPLQVANLGAISLGLRKRILQAWEHDIRAAMADVNEGGPVVDINVNVLQEIESAKSLLDEKCKNWRGQRRELSGTAA